MTIEFRPWPKTPRLMRDIIITEKIDGTNAAVGILPLRDVTHFRPNESFERSSLDEIKVLDRSVFAKVEHEGLLYGVYAQSRTRLITPGKDTDNYGFAGWVERNAEELVRLLGEGLHFGEWWGAGIQRKYGMDEKRFSLFNSHRFNSGYFQEMGTDLNIDGVPVLYQGPYDTAAISAVLGTLRSDGSVAAPGFMDPEGICVFHSASRQTSKVTLDKNDAGKWEAA